MTYSIERDPDSGLQVVRFNGKRIGTSQTEAAAKLIVRNHKRRNNA